jgi:hypothetical protein
MPAMLSSWKEIAAHLGKGVRTVQRWERELGLPIHRPVPGKKHIVIAYPDELDRWIRNEIEAEKRENSSPRHRTSLSRGVREQVQILHERTAQLLRERAVKRSK